MTEEKVRLQKYLAMANVASRRAAEEYIVQGRVKVNGNVCDVLGTTVSMTDKVEFDGKIVKIEEKKVYIAMNKPSGYVTTASDERGRDTVIDLVKNDISERVFPVGRLDYNTEGLLILTNDGDFTYKVTHPKHKVAKVYLAEVVGVPDRKALNELANGVLIDGKMTSRAKVDTVAINKNSSTLEITIFEGRNRQVRKMCEAVGHRVVHLKRTAIGNVKLSHLPLGKWRHLTDREIKDLLGEK